MMGATRAPAGSTAIANIGAAVLLFPIVKRQSEAIARGYVATRFLESTVIVVGLIGGALPS
jgi:hypothetical protein